MERITVGQNSDLITEALHIADTVRIISDDVASQLPPPLRGGGLS